MNYMVQMKIKVIIKLLNTDYFLYKSEIHNRFVTEPTCSAYILKVARVKICEEILRKLGNRLRNKNNFMLARINLHTWKVLNSWQINKNVWFVSITTMICYIIACPITLLFYKMGIDIWKSVLINLFYKGKRNRKKG